MSSIMNAFSSFSSGKRKRRSNDVSEDISEPDWKRRTTSLAFRSPPRQRPASIFTPANSTAFYNGALTPVDTSEDESINTDNNDDFSAGLPSLTESQTSNESNSTSSVKVHANTRDQDMEMTVSSPTRPRPGRARSNDIVSSARRRPNFLVPDSSHPAMHDRVPTPINSHFDMRLAEPANAPRHSFPPLRTNLSPMVEQENWVTGPDGLPSPTDDYSPQIHDSDALMGGLQLTCASDNDAMDADQMHISHSDRVTLDGYSSGIENRSHSRNQSQAHSRQSSQAQSHGRSARLHMGYLSGCEKCVQKVPGHYSHILWS